MTASETVITSENLQRLLLDAAGTNMELIEHFAIIYLCEKLKQSSGEKLAAALGNDVANGLSSMIREKEEEDTA